ncbi:siderophore ferric iron reductase [Pokkaliibacter sp. CJK22405]|uniref:siderophore ferric iron reductase n=1 Tax=Pokkaliibacter sp. CJK22405 TaxID=3384615 RepID=UPI003984C63B
MRRAEPSQLIARSGAYGVTSQSLIALSQRAIAGWDGQLVPQVTAWHHTDDVQLIQQYQHLAALHPEAGHGYWALRCWALLIWQPVTLAVLAATQLDSPLDCRELGLHLGENQLPCGYRLTPGAVCSQDCRSLQASANKLREQAGQLAERLGQLIRLSPTAAERLMADYALSALISCQQRMPGLSCEATLQLAEDWLSALHLTGTSRLQQIEDATSGESRLLLERRGCCLQFRCKDGLYCESCPRRKKASFETALN